MLYRTIKGQTRQYRKACRKLGLSFPLQGAFHVSFDGLTALRPNQLFRHEPEHLRIEPGPASDYVRTPDPVPELPAFAGSVMTPRELPKAFRKVVSEGICNGKPKTRTNYRPISNPKAGQLVYVKREINGKAKWVEVNYSDLLREYDNAAA